MYNKYEQMNNLLDSRKDSVLNSWLQIVPNLSSEYLSEPLIVKNKNNLLELNFDEEVTI